MMGHPMPLHGYHFQVVAIDGRRFAGARRDTVWLPPQRELTIAFDADNPRTWAFHCHHRYHMATGIIQIVLCQGRSDTGYLAQSHQVPVVGTSVARTHTT